MDRELQYDGPLCDPNVFDEARRIIDLSVFVSLIEAAKLEEIFLCAGPFTMLAPSNAAFAANPSITDYLDDPANVDDLREVILYSILPGYVPTGDLKAGPLETLQGDVVDVSLNPIMFNQAAVVESDILACNGAINIIDDILLPPGKCFLKLLQTDVLPLF